ncbi:hypothetical protein K6119_00020 [Paracrocinitomix mangrovi]|uniref:hypothetical protein n=1 Tax=Paracrocinitomix mangrovi TaxID=2862509 RepID=UPI001C8E6156|nr:hypothetical protein [Paracrocinitomix mangrovi]UKN01900.1 hypothetical protein K6119_00020 [Paracrocinitomix mangrovi]
MKQLLFNSLVTILLFGCGNSAGEMQEEQPQPTSTANPGFIENDSSETLPESYIEMFAGQWNLAVSVQNAWYKVQGCDEFYGVNFNKAIHKDVQWDLDMTMSDRMGMSVDFYYAIQKINFDTKEHFTMNCLDIYTDEKGKVISGEYHKDMENWPGEVIVLDRNEFSTSIIWGIMTGEEITGIRLYRGEAKGKQPQFVDEVGCDTGFDEEQLSALIPEAGLTGEEITDELIKSVLSFHGESFSDYSKVDFIDYNDFFMFIHMDQDGDVSTLTMYGIDRGGNKLMSESVAAVFEWLDNNKNYRIEGDKLFCKPGKFDYEDGVQKLISKDTYYYLDIGGDLIKEEK